MVKKLFIAVCFFCIVNFSFAQKNKTETARPKLVVGLVIDQMRWDYLYRYYNLYSSNGFKRLLNEGFSCENTLIPYLPTYTAPGHSCIYTGSVPAINGIVGNNWYDKTINKNVYCTDDSTVSNVGSNPATGHMSPRNLWTTTIGDELKLSNNFKSKVIGVSLKDRASILPAGHSANAAYWYDTTAGKWITSNYYMKELPYWVKNMNDKKLPDNYMAKDWNTILPMEKYGQSTEDNKIYEQKITGDTTVTFPHRLSQITIKKYNAFTYTPFAITYTFTMAKAAIENEQLGKNTVTDFLAINIASTDFIGHSFGPNSIEIEDTYLRLDNDIAAFLKFLDGKLGKNNYLLFLTADHGVANIPGFLHEHNIPAGLFTQPSLTKELNQFLEKKFSVKNAVLITENYEVYLNTDEIEKNGRSMAEIKEETIKFLKQKPYIFNAFESGNILQQSIPEPIKKMLINGYNPKRSGDIHFLLKPDYFDRINTGTTHGLWNPYDTHIPLLWYGWNIKHGKTNRETYMTDIAPTLAAMLKIQMPNGCVGKVIEEVMK